MTRRAAPAKLRVVIAWERGARRPRGYSAAHVRSAVTAACKVGGASAPHGELSIVFVDDERLAQIHGEWLDDPSRTDVITFDLGDGGGPAGELYVSAERAALIAKRRGLDPLRELLLYVVHGVLHLSGFDDHELRDRRRMRAAERRALALAGVAPRRVGPRASS